MSQVDEPGDEQADVLLDPNFDPGGGAMGTMGADGSVETNWFSLLHRRVTDRAVRSPRYQWWALVALLAGLLSLNITFTVFVVALPTVKADFNTNFSVLAWASTLGHHARIVVIVDRDALPLLVPGSACAQACSAARCLGLRLPGQLLSR